MHARWKKNQTSTNRVATAKSNTPDKKPNDDPYSIEKAFIMRKATIDQGNWYLDSCTSRYICNKKNSFSKLCLKSYEFMIADRDIIRSEKVDIIQLALLNKLDIMLSNVTFASRCNFNLISFGQLREARLSYHNHLRSIILKKARNIICLVQRKKNLFVLDLENNTDRIMIIQRRSRQ